MMFRVWRTVLMHWSRILLLSMCLVNIRVIKALDNESIRDPSDTQTMDILMRGAKPSQHDSYLCTSYPVDDEEAYIYKFEAKANASTAHHILMYGCEGEAYSKKTIWNCPSMCKGNKQAIMFAWAKNAPPTVLPSGVGLKIGKKTSIKTIVLQVHYAKAFPASSEGDYSGIQIYKTHEKQPYIAGIFLMLSTWFQVPPNDPSYYVDISCIYMKKKSMFPFAYRTHAHSLGKVITGYLFNGSYYEIGKGNPQWPQAFYPVQEKIEVKPGDALAARCTYDSSSKSEAVSIGGTGSDEMCNFYIMFYTESSVENPYDQCANNQYTRLTGKNFPKDVSVPLPPNPALEEEAHGAAHHHHHGGMGGGHEEPEPTTIEPPKHDIHFDHELVLNSSWPGNHFQIGQVGGLATDKQGNLYIFHRGSRTWAAQSFDHDNNFQFPDVPIAEDVVVILDPQGKLIRKFGAGQYFMPHGIAVDHEGSIWLTDVAMHQVFKINAGESKPNMTLGKQFQHGKGPSYFCKPSDVAVLSTGEFYVSDGYCNTRIMKYSKKGELLKSWGKPMSFEHRGQSPPGGTFDLPHSLAIAEDKQLLCVADRENGRIQCFDLDGNFKYIIKHHEFGTRVFAIEYCPEHGGILYAVNGPVFDRSDVPVSGFTLDISNGALLETWNIPQHLKYPHDVTVHPGSHSVYVGELNPTAVWKLVRADVPQPAHDHDHHSEEEKTPSTPELIEGNVKKGQLVQTKGGQVTSNSSGNDTVSVEKKSSEASSITPPVIIGFLLVIPVVLLLIITLLVRAHQSGKLKCYGGHDKKIFNFQRLLGNSHKGFDPLSTEESDHDLDPDDSDHDEYSAPRKSKA